MLTGSLLGLMLFLAAVAAFALAWLDTPAGQRWLVAELNRRLASEGVALRGLQGRLLGGWQLDSLTLSDARGRYLSLREIELQWRPLALLDGMIAVDKLTVETAELVRLPESGAAAGEEAPAATLPRLPLRLRLARFGVAQLALGAPVLGRAARLRLGGELVRAESGRVSGALEAVRLDRAGDRLEAGFAFAPQTAELALDLELIGEPGGLFAAAAGAGEDERVFLTLAGEGPITAWSGSLRGRLGDRAAIDADLERRGTRLEIAGTARIAELLAPPYAGLAAPEIVFAIASDAAGGSEVPLEMTLETAAGRLGADGTLALDPALDFDLGYRLRLADTAAVRDLLGGLAFGEWRAAGRLRGPPNRLELTSDIRVEAPALAELGEAAAARVSARASLGAATIPVELAMEMDGLRLPDLPPLDPRLSLAGSYDTAAVRARIARSRLEAGGLRLEIAGETALDGSSLTLEGLLAAPDLAHLAFAPSLPVSGRAGTEIRLDRSAAGAPLAIRLSAAGVGIEAEPPALAGLLGPAPRLSLEATLAGGGRLEIAALALEGAGGRLTADGPVDLGAETLAIAYRLAVPELAAVVASEDLALAGGTTVTGSIAGRFDALTAEARSEIDHVALQGIDLVDVGLTLAAENLAGETPALALRLDADSRFGAVGLAAEARLGSDGPIAADRIRLTVGTMEIEGGLRLGREGLVTGRLSGRTGDLAALPESRRYGIRGTLALDLEFAGAAGGDQRIVADIAGERLILPAGGTQILEIERFVLDGSAVLSRPTPRIDGRLEAVDARVGFTRLSRLVMDAEATSERLAVSAAAEGEWRGPLDLEGRLLFSGAAGGHRVSVEMAGTVFGQSLALSEPALLTLEETGWMLDPLRLRLGERGRIAATARREAGSFATRLTAEAVPLELVNVFLPRLYPAGTLSAEARIEQQEGDAMGTVRLRLRDVEPAVAGFAETPPFDLDAEAELAQNRVMLTAAARAPDALDARLEAALPTRIDLLAGDFGLEPEAPLAGRFAWRGALAPIFMVVNLPQHEAYGEITADLAIGGTPAAPEVSGGLAITETRYEHLPSGFVARDLALRARLDGRRAEILSLDAADGEGGRLEGQGWVELAPDGLLADVGLTLDRLHLLRRADVKAVASGTLGFRAEEAAMRAAGALRADRVEIDIGRELPESVVDIEVIEVETEDAQEGEPGQRPRAAAQERPFALDLRVTAERRLFVRGRGLDSEWAADLELTGTAADPRLQGTARLVKGVFEFAGRRFTLGEGELLFAGGEEVDPMIDLTARETVEGLQITLTLGGSLSAPTVGLSSTPALPEDEILARILFGSSVADLSALQLVQLASAVGGLSGGGFDVVGGARGLLGLDRLTITTGTDSETGEDGGPTIAGGKYLSDNVYLEMSTETGTGITAGTLEWSLTKNLSLESRVSSGRDNSIRLRWSWNY